MQCSIIIAKELISTPLGLMISGFIGNELCLLKFIHNKNIKKISISSNNIHKYIPPTLIKTHKIHVQNLEKWPFFLNLTHQIKEYFEGKRKKFEINFTLIGTAFQKKVWNTLSNLDYGKVISYKELAIKLGDIKLCRAVAQANANNKLAIIIPCHRVINSNGKLGGYSAGIWRKQKLLELEMKNITINGGGFLPQSF